jgi:hypothetical protein
MTTFRAFCQVNAVEEQLSEFAESLDQYLELRLQEERAVLRDILLVFIHEELQNNIMDLVQLRAKLNKLEELVEACCGGGETPPGGGEYA